MPENKPKPTKPEVYRESNSPGAKGQVGRDIPDESKEHHTEIAVDAGHKDGEHRPKKP
ncbi:MAG: hypothetical protein ACM3JG_03050 [Thiohalocapsa sp.]